MEQENQPTAQQNIPAQEEQHVGFPEPVTEEKKGGMIKWIIAGIGILIIVAIGIFFVMQSSGEGEELAETDTTNEDGDVLSTFPTPQATETATPTTTPEPEPVDKTEINVEILNGTGTPGDAGFVSDELVGLGFEVDNIDAANADDQEETQTTITYTRDLDSSVIDEIVEALEAEFGKIKTRKGTVSGDFDIRILTGPRGEDDAMEKETSE